MSASAYNQVHIPRPKLWQDFEKGSALLWRRILDDPSIHRFGKNGQAQHGMDMYGYRDGDTGKIVGVQCKCKGLGEKATEKELRADFEKALKYEPRLTEYFFTTTSDDDAPLSTVAAKLTDEQRVLGRTIVVRAWGWDTLEDQISAHPDAALMFDPNHSPTAELQSQRHEEIIGLQSNHLVEIREVKALLLARATVDGFSTDPAEAALDAEIDRYRDRANKGKPRSSLDLLNDLLKTLTEKNSGHIWFRVKANIAHCHLQLSDEATAAEMLEEAVAHAPEDPKAAANAVLAMMLRGDHQNAFEQGLAELTKSTDNEVLAGYVVQAGGYAGVADAIDRIPEGVRASEAVRKYHLLNLRNAGDPSWIELARRGREGDAEDEFYKRHAAEADITEIVDGDHRTSWKLTAEGRERVRQAGKDLVDLWNLAKKEEAPDRPDHLALCINGALALLAAGDSEAAKKLVLEGAAISGGKDPEIQVHVAAFAMELGDEALAREAFPNLAEVGPALLMRAQIAARLGDWDYLMGLDGTQALETIPETERDLVKALASSASIKKIALDDPAGASSDLNDMIVLYQKCGRASVLLAQLADELGLPEASSHAYGNALASISNSSHIASRTMVAGYATRLHDHAAVIRLMDGYVDDNVDSKELFDLANAFAYEFPPRARAVEFFANLEDSIRNLRQYVMLEGIMHYHRGELNLAEDRFLKSRELSPDFIKPILMHAQTLFRLKRKSELPALVADLDVSSMQGSPREKMNLAHLLVAGGRTEDGLDLGYAVLDADRNDPKVALKWIGLVLGQLQRVHELSDAAVGVGMWTSLASEDGQTNQFLVVDGPGEPSDKKFGKGHVLAEAAIGHRVGDSFDVEDRFGRTVRWTVQQVRHKYMYAYADLTENFNIRFPDEDGFYVIRTVGDDIGPFLDVMRWQGEQRERIHQLYTNGPLPISVLTELSGGGSVLRFADSLRAEGIGIEACEGALPERNWATRTAKAHFGKGVVLDTLTYWAVVGINGLDVLKDLFGRVLLARSTADEIVQLHENDGLVPEAEHSGSAYFHKGQFYFDEFTPDRAKQLADAIAMREDAMQTDCNVVPVHAPNDIDPKLLETIRHGALDPIFVAREHGMLLVTDDKRYRDWAGGLNVRAVWLQAIFLAAKESGRLGDKVYARLVAQLALLRHTSIACSADDIVEIVAQATPETRYTIDAIAEAIGVEKADIHSHYRVTTEAVIRLLQTGPTPNAEYAIGLLMRNLLRYRTTDRRQILSGLRRTLSNQQGGSDLFDRWKKGRSTDDGFTLVGPRAAHGRKPDPGTLSKRNAAVKARAKRDHRRTFGKR
jgi:tetratricopeptide (TPR) repeat protein